MYQYEFKLKPQPIDPERYVWLELASNGVSYSLIGQAFNVHPTTVKTFCDKYDIQQASPKSEQGKQAVRALLNKLMTNLQEDANKPNMHLQAFANRSDAIKRLADYLVDS